jgi:hypothetical protein
MLAAPKLLNAFLAAITREYRFSATGIFFGLKVREGMRFRFDQMNRGMRILLP